MMIREKCKIFLFLPTLHIGGTEKQVYILSKELKRRRFDVVIGTFYKDGFFWKKCCQDGIKIISFERRGKWDFVSFYKKIVYFLKDNNPQIVQTFLPVANFFGIKAAKDAGIRNIFAGIRASYMDLFKYNIGNRVYFYLSRKITNRYAKGIIYNSFAGRNYHTEKGFKDGGLYGME